MAIIIKKEGNTMLEQQLQEIIQKAGQKKNEDTTLEFKAAKRGTPETLYDTLSSFSNTAGGTIVFGIDENHNFDVCGVQDSRDLIKNVSRQCDEMEPKVIPLFTQTEYNGRVIVSAEIAEMDYLNKPCFYKGKGKAKGSYIRVGDADEVMSDYEIYSFEVYKRKVDEELRTNSRVTSQDIDTRLLNGFIDKLLLVKPNLRNMSNEDILRANGLLTDDQPTLCSLLCFGKIPQMISPMLDIVCANPATDTYGVSDNHGVRFLSSPRIDGTLSEMVDGALAYVLNNMKKKIIVGKDGKRHDEPEYPELAVREAILNAVIHRDYSIFTETCPITVTLFSDRLEITNPGALFGRMTLEDLGKKNADTRNPFIAFAMEIIQNTENRFSGIPTMRAAMKEAGLLPPVFENGRDYFKVTLYNKKTEGAAANEPTEENIIAFCQEPRTKSQLAENFGFDGKRPSFFFKSYILPLIHQQKLFLTLPDHPRSKNQKIVAH
jgi:ATP-dependent DNA helicase RecG